MRNAIIGFICLVIIVFSGVAIQTSGNTNVRQNELDSTLSTAMQNSMEILTVNPLYMIDENSSKEFVADFIQSMLLSTTSDAEFNVTVHSVDAKKGILDVEVQERYKQVVGEGRVIARKKTVLEDYKNSTNVYYTVTFQDSGQSNKVIKQTNIHGGDALSASILPVSLTPPKGMRLTGWVLINPSVSGIYNDININTVRVTKDLTFSTNYVQK